MLYIITSQNYHYYQQSLTKAFQKREFKIPLFQEEVMPFDAFPEVVYLVGVDDDVGICGLARLLPTTGSHVCQHLFPEKVQASAQLWELSALHFFLPPNLDILRCEQTLAKVADTFYCELFKSLYGFACQEGIHQILVLDHHLTVQDLWHVGWPLVDVKQNRSQITSFPIATKMMTISLTSYHQFLVNRGNITRNFYFVTVDK